jgi:threonine synthase
MTPSPTPRAAGVLARYGAYLPLTERTPALTLHEGDTPLIAAPRLGAWVGVSDLHLKFEGMNPTGSFKDRGMVVAIAKAVEAGARTVVCASTGNTSASAAAYAARAGLRAVVLLPEGKVAPGKLAQAVQHGADVVVLATNFDGALDIARAAAERWPVALVNSVNPFRVEGQTTAAYEICDALGDAPDVLALPVGNGGNITAYWLGFRRYRERGQTERVPRLLGAQAAGAAPLVHGRPVPHPETVATAIRIGRPATWQPALDAAADSGGAIRAVSDEEILAAYRAVARQEGVFCEPASAAGIAALRNAVRDGFVASDARCVCVLTGNGLKDPETPLRDGLALLRLEATVEALASLLEA